MKCPFGVPVWPGGIKVSLVVFGVPAADGNMGKSDTESRCWSHLDSAQPAQAGWREPALPLYLLRDLPATRSFLAATGKTLGFTLGQPRMQN